MPDDVIPSLPKAKAIFRKHAAEQKEAGRRKAPDAWLNPSKDRLVIVVYGESEKGPVTKPYEYELAFKCEGVHEITAPSLETVRPRTTGSRKKNEPAKALPAARQLHMFELG